MYEKEKQAESCNVTDKSGAAKVRVKTYNGRNTYELVEYTCAKQ